MRISKPLSKLGSFARHTLFPPLCLHCQSHLASPTLFCGPCAGYFELADPRYRCLYCFKEQEESRPCEECLQNKRWGLKRATTLDPFGPVLSFCSHLKSGRMPHLIKTASALMLAQWVRLNWPQPDLLIPYPESFFFQNNDLSCVMAHELSKSLESEVSCALGRLPYQFFLKRDEEIEDAILLIVGLYLEMEEFEKMAETLEERFPAKIYGLSLI